MDLFGNSATMHAFLKRRQIMFKKTALSLALFLAGSLANANVLTSVKPLGFIANAITEGVTDTNVLLPVSASPHDYSLKPSDVTTLQSAQLIVWIGDEMESFLAKSIKKLPPDRVLTLENVVEIKQHVVESDHDHHAHSHKTHSKHEHHHNHDKDWHIWLSPHISEHIAEQIAKRLSETMPTQKTKIEQNLAQFKQRLAEKNQQITQQLMPLKTKGYYTFHDAYSYFERAYGLNPLGSFTINPTVAPGAKTLAKIKQNIAKNQAQCLFAEPQFTPKVIESLTQNTRAKIGQLDPLGANIPLSKTAYPEFLQALADQFSQCLEM